MSESFEALATSTGIALPATLRQLIGSGRTSYDKPDCMALSALYDFRWLSAQRAGEVIASWLNPVKQNGNVFLPFGRSGAGDAYCLVRLRSGEEGVAMVWRDRSASRLRYASFDHFVVAEYLAVFADLDLLDDDAGDPAACLRADVAKVAGLLDPALERMLHACLDKPPSGHPYRQGPASRPEIVFSLISQAEEEALYARVSMPEPLAFDVVARWE
ncbi:SMI1/KNR4 family protein [Massilia antarctica]|uniref:SMI1/KNR4 family protein n=1 Tax=Massilia antarctica TaxID=2765360 RepID=A0AA49A7F1_9BURK|nr:SMI1/KNR4 family protein [Massilia antarctica]QPI48722.1 SMI1/KNR4 family protein [Massilia antarctica]